MKINVMTSKYKYQQGFTIIEIMVAMVIGLVLMSGFFQIFISSKENQDIVFAQVELVDESRVALDILAYDLKRSGLWGRTNKARQLYTTENSPSFETVVSKIPAGDLCINANGNNGFKNNNIIAYDPGWAFDVTRPIYGVSEANVVATYSNCMKGSYLRGDVVEMRYAGEKIAVADLDDNTVYIVSQGPFSDLFIAASPPAQPKGGEDQVAKGNLRYDLSSSELIPVTYHKYEVILYYVGSWTDSIADNVPSLRRISLQAGPALVDEVVLTGVETLQIQFGRDATGSASEAVQRYWDPSLIDNTDNENQWGQVRSAQAWIVVKAKESRIDNVGQTFKIPGVPGSGQYPAAAPTDGYKRFMASVTTKLRNIDFLE